MNENEILRSDKEPPNMVTHYQYLAYALETVLLNSRPGGNVEKEPASSPFSSAKVEHTAVGAILNAWMSRGSKLKQKLPRLPSSNRV